MERNKDSDLGSRAWRKIIRFRPKIKNQNKLEIVEIPSIFTLTLLLVDIEHISTGFLSASFDKINQYITIALLQEFIH